jgi:DNA-binding SARP family transcriptional activator
VTRGTDLVNLGTRKQRALVASLALYGGRPVPVDLVVDLLWGERPPAAVSTTLQAYVAGLRKALEPGRAPRAAATVLVTVGSAYALRVPPDRVDASRFATAVRTQHARMAPVTGFLARSAATLPGVADLEEVAVELDRVLGLWRGEPYADLGDADHARAERTRLDELRLVALEDRALARIWLGQHATVAPELESLTSAYPLRERLWGLSALALTRSGRQADALQALRRVREVLDEELGLEPGAELRALQHAVLTQDPALGWTPDGAGERAPVPTGEPVPPAVEPVTATNPLPSPGWAMVGRAGPLAALTAGLDALAAGRSCLATVVGDPGIGKTRLAGELASRAVGRGVRVALGRCSQDEGAPPLWPWTSVLAALGRDLPPSTPDQSPFTVWDGIVIALVEAATEHPTLVLLDDLHWADVASLRVLRLLAESPVHAALMVLATWRPRPVPTGAFADAAEMLARAHAVRVDLHGLNQEAAADVVTALTSVRPSPAVAAELVARTDGNPFFLVEYARLADDDGDLTQLRSGAPPAAVQDVLQRRLGRLPEPTRDVLRVAAVVGRDFDLRVLTGSLDRDDDAVLDALEPAQLADLVREEGIDRFRFAHALVRDVVYASVPLSRRSRWHARVARAVAGRPGREAEVALHWGEAGPAYAGEAWRAALAAAASARAVHAHDDRVALLRRAVGAQGLDAAVTAEDRFATLLELVDACRWTSDWALLVATVGTAVELADAAGDLGWLARAATAPTVGAITRSAPSGELNAAVIGALRRCLAGLPAADGAERCRVMLSLANELYHGTTLAERTELVLQARAMAHRLADPQLRIDADLIGFAAVWVAETAADRLGWAEEALELATAHGPEQAVVVAATMRAVAQGERGLVAQMWASAEVAAAHARRLHIPFGLLVLESLTLPWHAMAGEFARGEEQLEQIVALQGRMALHADEDAVGAAVLSLRLWQGRGDELVDELAAADGELAPLASTVAVLHLRAGHPDRAAAYLAEHPIRTERHDAASVVNWCLAAEVALELGDPTLGAAMYARLAPSAGQAASWGSSFALGPVHAFLALAAAATHELALARDHAEEAARQIVAWGIPLAGDWLAALRDRYGF